MLDIKRFLRAASLLATAVLASAGAHSAARAATARATMFHPKIAVAKPGALVRVTGARPRATTLRYTIVDRGSPAESKFVLDSAPLVFNNTGQIAGVAYDSVTQRAVCELYDGRRFRDLSAATSITGCVVDAIGDAGASGSSVDVVGYATTVYTNDFFKAFYAQAPLDAGTIKTTIFPNDRALLTGVNASGTAVGLGDYSPSAGFATQRPPFTVTPGRSALALLQPECTTPAAGCGAYNKSFDDQDDGVCPFGGCRITADGTLLLSDLFTGSYETVTPGGSAHDVVLAADLNSIPTINNAKQLAYSIVTIVSGVTQVRTQIYTIGTASVTTIPPLPGSSCKQYTPLSMNNQGHVLGHTSECPLFDYTYFTYDPTHGTQDLATAVPTGSFSLFPQAINDKDEILVSLAPTAGTSAHWALLEPIPTDAERSTVAMTSHWVMAASTSSTRPQRTSTVRTAGKARPALSIAPRFAPRPVRLRGRSATSASPRYTVVDYGAPAVSNYALEMPVAFNNTGQIVGVARDLPYVNGSTCILFDGTRFRNISASPAITNCTPRAIDDESSVGRLSVVGTAYATYSDRSGSGDQKAFESTIAPNTGFVGTTLFGGNDMSDLTGINASGRAIGVGAYGSSPNTGVEQTFSLAPGKLSLDLLQPACVSAGVSCGILLEIGCAFGGCNITADGSLYLYNEVVGPNGAVQPVQFDGNTYGSIINNAKQILYDAFVVHGGQYYIESRIYQVGTGAVTNVPPLAGSTCLHFFPLSFNNQGQVLGETDDCMNAADQTYFIYDPVNGTRDLLAALPTGNGSIEPIGINDKGEIAFGLAIADGITHWGLLEPIAPARLLRRGGSARPLVH